MCCVYVAGKGGGGLSPSVTGDVGTACTNAGRSCRWVMSDIVHCVGTVGGLRQRSI